jgi:5'/3'-nucleotidase SurE
MHTLVVSADGIDATGLAVLLDALYDRYPKTKHVALIPTKPSPTFGSGTVVPQGKTLEVKAYSHPQYANVYKVTGSAVDAMYHGLANSKEFLGFDQQFNMVVTGVNHGAVVGIDVFHSAAVMAALLASYRFGVPALSFAQELEEPQPGAIDRALFDIADKLVRRSLDSLAVTPGECLLVNYPTHAPRGYRNVISVRQRFGERIPPSKHFDDIQTLKDGYVTVTELSLNVNLPYRY